MGPMKKQAMKRGGKPMKRGGKAKKQVKKKKMMGGGMPGNPSKVRHGKAS